MPSAQSLALSKPWLYLLSLSCQPHPGFLWSGAPQKVSRETSAPASLGAREKPSRILHAPQTFTVRTSGLRTQRSAWTGPRGGLHAWSVWEAPIWRSYCVNPHPDTHLALCPAPPHSWELQELQVWEETEVGSGKGLLTQYFRMDRQRVWRVLAHPCLKRRQWRGELGRISEHPCRKPGSVRRALQGRAPNPLIQGMQTCQPECPWLLLPPEQQLSPPAHASPFSGPGGEGCTVQLLGLSAGLCFWDPTSRLQQTLVPGATHLVSQLT